MNEPIRLQYFKQTASAKSIYQFIEAKKKSKEVYQKLLYADKVLEKEKEIQIAKNDLWIGWGIVEQ